MVEVSPGLLTFASSSVAQIDYTLTLLALYRVNPSLKKSRLYGVPVPLCSTGEVSPRLSKGQEKAEGLSKLSMVAARVTSILDAVMKRSFSVISRIL